MKEKLQFCLDKISLIRSKLPKKKPHSEKYYKMIAFLNKYSLVFHFILACVLTFAIEVISRRDFLSTISFLHNHTLAYLYNAFIVFASLSNVYLFRCRPQLRVLISGLWLFLGTINGLILSNRVTPFSYTDLKCISDLFAMQNTNYFTAEEATLVVGVVVAFFVFLGFFFAKGPKYQGKRHFVLGPVSIAALLLVGLPITTQAAQGSNILASYFSNIAQGYADYGFVYGFSTSVVGRGMSKPDDYSEETVDAIETLVNSSKEQTTVSTGSEPNIICVLLESFCDPYEVNFLNMSEDPIPNFHNLESNYSTGYLTVPVVGAGTANTEFEVLTGMSMQYFGTGEYPYKTTLKEIDSCESIASDLGSLGYGTHVVHNNGGNFYSRANAFSLMGFDSFTSKECMNIQEYTPLGSWPTDNILISETLKAMDSTPDQSDLVYTITVQGHGDYPEEQVIEDPKIKVEGIENEALKNKWEYYVNQVYEMDKFAGDLVKAVEDRGEPTVIVFYGDHLPTMGLQAEDLKSRYLYNTNYVIWDNIGLEQQDKNIPAYQIMSEVFERLGIHSRTIFNYHQERKGTKNYLSDLELLQYDILYGKQYVYNGNPPITEGHMQMGVKDVTLSEIVPHLESGYSLYGENFTKSSKVYVNGEKQKSTFLNNTRIELPDTSDLQYGDIITVSQVGSSNTVFRTSNEYVYQNGQLIEKPDTGSGIEGKSWLETTKEQGD